MTEAKVTPGQVKKLRAITSTFARTDLGNAERLVALHGSDLRFAPGLGWYAWDGRRWRPDNDREVMRRAQLTVRSIYGEAERADDEGDRSKLVKHGASSEARPRLEAAVALASCASELVLRPEQLDANHFLLNVENGTIDLRTGELREHQREDLLTKLAPVVYRPEVDPTQWLRFIARVTEGDEELQAFLKCAAGYTLTGDTSEEVLFFAHGPTETGKSTFLEAFRAMLGDYGATANFETFLARKGESGVNAEIARFVGARMVVGVEVDEGKRLAEGLLKLLTGGDTVTAKRLYENPFEYRPVFKLWLGANDRPEVNASDGAIWRRIVQVPFTAVIPKDEQDPGLKRRLREDPDQRSAILRWAVEGGLDWQREGLKVPARVLAYTAEYRAENDPVSEWLEVCCEFRSGASTETGDLLASYRTWAEGNGEKELTAKKLGKILKDRGLEPGRTTSRRFWPGIALKRSTRSRSAHDGSDAYDGTFQEPPLRARDKEVYGNGRHKRHPSSGNDQGANTAEPAQPQLIAVKDVLQMGIEGLKYRQQLKRFRDSDTDPFPRPDVEPDSGPLWRRRNVEEWARGVGRL
jgi:putative DNA primase/helicase